jgi:hypothetical protein
VNSGKLAKPRSPTATVETWIAAKKLTQMQCEHDAVRRESDNRTARARRRRMRRMPSAAAAIAVRPRTIATGDSASPLAEHPAKPNSATATCSAMSAAAFVIVTGGELSHRRALCHQPLHSNRAC